MFRKGIVTFFDDRLGLGHIELVADHRQIIFKLENFSNTSLLPQIGERVKCIVVEEHGEFLAKFIVRLDHKNYVADKKKPLSSHYAYDENSFENVRNSRKILKKRRISADHIAHENEHSPDNILSDQNHTSEKEENQSTNQRNTFATQSTKTIQFQQVAIQPQIIKSSAYTEPFVEAIKPIQIKEAQPVVDEVVVVDIHQPIVDEQIPESIETVQVLETTESIQQIQVEEVQPVVDEVVVIDTQQPTVDEQIPESIETVQVLETTEAIQSIQVKAVQPVVDEVAVVDTHQPIVDEQLLEPIETVQVLETTESIQQIQVEEVQPVVDEVVVIDTQQPIVDEQIPESIETVQALEITESTQQIQVEEVQSVVDEVVVVDTQQPIVEEQIFEPVKTVQALETTESTQQIQFEEVRPVVDEVVVIDTQQPIVEEQILEPVVQKVEIVEPLQSNLSIEKATESIPVVIQVIETATVADAFPPVKDKAEPNANNVDRQKQLLERQLLEKNMNLTASQKFIQKMKVKFLYSKRKQTQAKPEVKKQFSFNPWILVTGVVLLGVINLGFYARDQYTEYKTESLLKLQQYENAQKEEIKRQKKEATAR